MEPALIHTFVLNFNYHYTRTLFTLHFSSQFRRIHCSQFKHYSSCVWNTKLITVAINVFIFTSENLQKQMCRFVTIQKNQHGQHWIVNKLICVCAQYISLCVYILGADRAGVHVSGETWLGETWLVQQRGTCSCKSPTYVIYAHVGI